MKTRAIGKSYLYSAPEAIEGLSSEMESDYYSLGLIMYEMMTRKRVPFALIQPFVLLSSLKRK